MNLPLVLLIIYLASVSLVFSDCENSNCQNGGSCVPQDLGYNWGYYCLCPAGYNGAQCQWDNTSICVDKTITPCKNNGKCINGTNPEERYCDCPNKSATWFNYGGHYCELVDPCRTCPNGTTTCQSIPTQKSGRICLDSNNVTLMVNEKYFA